MSRDKAASARVGSKALVAIVSASLAFSTSAALIEKTIDVGGRERTYFLHVPTKMERPAPLVFVFHGGGATAKSMLRASRFHQLADREGFIAVYPEAFRRNWNDGREDSNIPAHRQKIDDVGFVAAMLNTLSEKYEIDAKRVYATGISNGGMFSHFVAANMADRIAAIAPVVGGLAEPLSARFCPSSPVAVLIMQGTEDPLVPYAGGAILNTRGKIIATDDAAKAWAQANGCSKEAREEESLDKDPNDSCIVKSYAWSGCRDNAEVKLLKMEGAGHTWPKGPQYLPQWIIGKVCHELDGTDVIWEFFKQHPKR